MKPKQLKNAHKLMEDILDLYDGLLIPYMKVRRDIPSLVDKEGQETDGDHAFMLAMVSITLAYRMGLELDHGKIAQYALIHDLVEAHAGDISARSTDEEQVIKIDREREARLIIKERYAKKAQWIPELIESYEAKSDEEAKFVYAVDKQMGTYTWMAGKGKGWYYRPDGTDFHQVVKRLRKKASVYPELLPLFDEIHEELDKRRKNY